MTQGDITKYFGFLSFGHYSNDDHHGITAAGSPHQATDLSVTTDGLDVSGTFLHVHHFAAQMAVPMLPLSTIASRTKATEVDTGVVDMRYENPLYLAEEATALDLVVDGRTTLGVSRGVPKIVNRGWESFGYHSEERDGADLACAHYERSLDATDGKSMAEVAPLCGQHPTQMNPGMPLPAPPHSPDLRSRIWYGAGFSAPAVQMARDSIDLVSLIPAFEHGGRSFGDIQTEQLRVYRQAWTQTGHGWTSRMSVSRSIFPLLSERDRGLYDLSISGDQVRYLDSSITTFERTYAVVPLTLIKQLSQDRVLAEANTLLPTISNQSKSEEDWSIIRNFMKYVVPMLGQEPTHPGVLPTGHGIDEAMAKQGVIRGSAD